MQCCGSIVSNADPNPVFHLNTDPDPLMRINADPDQTLKSRKVELLHEKYTKSR